MGFTIQVHIIQRPTFGIKKIAHNTNKFKHELKKLLLNNSFYSVAEYMDRDAT